MGDLENVGGFLTAVVLVSAIAGGAFGTTSSSTSTSSTSTTGGTSSATNIQTTSGSSCTVGHAMGSQDVRLDGTTMATLTQYYGTCGGQPRNWATLQFTDAAMQYYSTQGTAAIVQRDGVARTLGSVSDESTSRVTSVPVATVTYCTTASATVSVVRLSDGKRFGPASVSTPRRC